MMDSGSDLDSDDSAECIEEPEKVLPFDRTCLGDVILDTSDLFYMRVIMNKEKKLVFEGQSVTDGFMCYHCDMDTGPEIGELVCSECGLDITDFSLRDIWYHIEYKLSTLYDAVYEFLVGLGLKDYLQTATFLRHHEDRIKLATIIINNASSILGEDDMEIRSTLTDA